MTRSLGLIIGDTLQRSLDYAESLLKSIPAERFARLAAPSGRIIESNHPAFIFGHLSLYGARMANLAGSIAPALPDGFDKLFSKDAQCLDDIDGNIYPPMKEITAAFSSGYAAALSAVLAADDSAFSQPNPAGGKTAERFPTAGSMANFLAGGHLMLHLGQMSAWRRMEGIGPA